MSIELDTGTIHLDEKVAEGFLKRPHNMDSTLLSTVQMDDIQMGSCPVATIEGATSGTMEGMEPGEHTRFVGSPLEDTEMVSMFPREKAQIQMLDAGRRPGIVEWLSLIGRDLARPWVVTLAAIQLNLARLSLDDRCTAGVDVNVVVQRLAEDRAVRVSVSPELVMPRSDVRATSLRITSGVKLTWKAMLSEDKESGKEN